MAGCVTAATTKPLESANKALRYAKANADVGLDFRHLGPREDMTFVAFSDASFGCRPDLASQGGFLLLMVNKDVTEGTEGYYNILDWRSWKLARIARSTLKRLSHRPHLKQQTRCCSLALSGIWSGSRDCQDLQQSKTGGGRQGLVRHADPPPCPSYIWIR